MKKVMDSIAILVIILFVVGSIYLLIFWLPNTSGDTRFSFIIGLLILKSVAGEN